MRPPPPEPQLSSGPGESHLTGVLERIIFFNEETQYYIGEFRPQKERRLLTVTGHLPGVQCGETLHLVGKWRRHPSHGAQFKISAYQSTLPSSLYGIRKYLGSGLVPGVGKGYADKIVDYFGTETLKIISEESARLREVPGIGKERARAIKKSWESQQVIRDIMMFLQTYGISPARCMRLVDKYGAEAKEIIKTKPYRVAREIAGIGFKTADKIALNLGFSNHSPERIKAGIHYALESLEDEGHTGFPPEEFKSYASALLEIEPNAVAEGLREQLEKGALKLSNRSGLLQLPATAHAEEKIAESIERLLHHPSRLPPIKIDIALNWAQEKAGFGFAERQREAVRSSLTHKLSIITGGPGTGKTTILQAVVEILRAKKVKLLLASPTGRAAQRLAQATGVHARTIHRLLKFDPAGRTFTVHEHAPLKVDALIVDEASMLDNRLASALFRAIPSSAHLILVGDVNQLPSVGAGNVLKDLIRSGLVPVTRLEKVFRQVEQSDIIKAAWEILRGNPSPPFLETSLKPAEAKRDFHFLRTASPEECVERVLSICGDFVPRYTGFRSLSDLQVLVPMHRGVAGITNLNHALQTQLNPGKGGISIGTALFRAGDKVIQTRNNYEKNIFNGDLGIISKVNPDTGTLTVRFHDEFVEIERFALSDLQLAYATSIHKSQGSEFPVVVIPLLRQHYMMLQRNLLYTAVTRGKEKVFLVGDPTAYAMAVRNSKSARRHTGLRQRIEASLASEG